MARRKLLPTYLTGQAWVDMCDAIDVVFAEAVDTPTDNLGKLRDLWLTNATTEGKVELAQLIPEADLDIFERTILVKQLNMLGYALRDPKGLTDEQLARMVRNMSVYWYSKGKEDLSGFLSYTLGTDVIMSNMWTQDYLNFYPEGDPIIGTPIWEGGTWYPTTHTTVEVDLLTMPSSMTIETFAGIFNDISNYPLVLLYIVSASRIPISSSLGDFIPVAMGGISNDYFIIANFVLGSGDITTGHSGGGYTPIAGGSIGGNVPWINNSSVVQPWNNNLSNEIPWYTG